MMLGLILKTEVVEAHSDDLTGGRYLGIPRMTVSRCRETEARAADAHNCGLLSVQETGCGTQWVKQTERWRPDSLQTRKCREEGVSRMLPRWIDRHRGERSQTFKADRLL